MYLEGTELIIITEPKIVHFDLPEDVRNNLKHEIDSMLKHDELLA